MRRACHVGLAGRQRSSQRHAEELSGSADQQQRSMQGHYPSSRITICRLKPASQPASTAQHSSTQLNSASELCRPQTVLAAAVQDSACAPLGVRPRADVTPVSGDLTAAGLPADSEGSGELPSKERLARARASSRSLQQARGQEGRRLSTRKGWWLGLWVG